MGQAELTRKIIKHNATMIDSLLTSEEQKHFKYGFSSYLINMLNEKQRLSKQLKNK